MTNTAGAVIAAQRMRAERDIIEALRTAGAFTAETATPLAPDRNLARLALRGLLRQNAVRQAAPGHYYLDEPVYAAVEKNRQRLMIGVAVIAVVFGVAIAIATSSRAQTPEPRAERLAFRALPPADRPRDGNLSAVLHGSNPAAPALPLLAHRAVVEADRAD